MGCLFSVFCNPFSPCCRPGTVRGPVGYFPCQLGCDLQSYVAGVTVGGLVTSLVTMLRMDSRCTTFGSLTVDLYAGSWAGGAIWITRRIFVIRGEVCVMFTGLKSIINQFDYCEDVPLPLGHSYLTINLLTLHIFSWSNISLYTHTIRCNQWNPLHYRLPYKALLVIQI